MWTLTRPEKPALPASYFWTWDHSTNWELDDPGSLNFGCYNRYLKRPETFIEDYRRLTDLAAALGVKGIVIWGFLRDSHGGPEAARQVCAYAADRGVAILPGVGTTWYGGCYYEGDHPYNMETFLRAHPDARLINPEYDRYATGVCPTHPLWQAWLQEGLAWLFREFPIGGVNLENGDWVVCLEARCRQHRETWPAADPDVFRMQYLAYEPALRALGTALDPSLITYATYTGFTPGNPPASDPQNWTYLHCDRPVLCNRFPRGALCQWTLTGMVRSQPLPLADYLEDGVPDAVFDNPLWPRDLRAPATRSVGFLHQGSQWHQGRYQLIVSSIKEACLRGFLAGLEGISILGEVSLRHIPWALNYLAFSHFIHWPQDSLRQFGQATLGQVLGDAEEGEHFAELLAGWDSGTLTPTQREALDRHADACRQEVSLGQGLEQYRFWNWLQQMAHGRLEPHTVSFL